MVEFKKATRQAVKLKMAISGPSGAGKTLGALALARAIAPKGKLAVIDTENGSASLYGDRYEFDVLDLAPPFTSKRYLEAMEAAVEAGYDVLVIDSLSHQWNGEGGILSRKEEMDKRPGANSYTNWATFTKEHTSFLSSILQLPVHVITTLRSKQDYVLETNEKGKQTPKKVGMAPVQREGLEYEFSTVFELQMDHRATASKDRTGLFADRLVDLADVKVGRELVQWLSTAAPVVAKADAAPVTEAVADETPLASQQQRLEITGILGDPRIDDELRAQVKAALGKPMKATRAVEVIAGLRGRIAAVNAADKAKPIVEPTYDTETAAA